MLFKSSYPDIDVPSQIPLWDWLFGPDSTSFRSIPTKMLSGFTNTDTNERLTHLQIKEYSTYLSTALVLDHGLQEGDVVSICSTNSVWFPVGLFGVMRVGGLSALSSPGYTEDEMVHVLKTIGIDSERVFLLDGQMKGFKSLRDLIDAGKRCRESNQLEPFRLPLGKSNDEVCTLLCFSSGTTGLPKAVMVSHQNIIAQMLQLLPTTSDDHRTILGLLPFYHITGVVRMLMLPFVINAEVIILPNFTMKGLLDAITKHRIAEVQMVPPIIIRMVRDPLVDQYDLSCIKRFASGAAPISAEVLQLLEQKFPSRDHRSDIQEREREDIEEDSKRQFQI